VREVATIALSGLLIFAPAVSIVAVIGGVVGVVLTILYGNPKSLWDWVGLAACVVTATAGVLAAAGVLTISAPILVAGGIAATAYGIYSAWPKIAEAGEAIWNAGKSLITKGYNAGNRLVRAGYHTGKRWGIRGYNGVRSLAKTGLRAARTGLGIVRDLGSSAVKRVGGLFTSAKDYLLGK